MTFWIKYVCVCVCVRACMYVCVCLCVCIAQCGQMTLGYAVLQDAFQQLSNIEGRGLLGDLDSDVVEGVKQEEDDDYDQLAAGDGRPSSSEPIDFVDIDEVAEDQEEAEAQRRLQERRLQERRLQQEYYAKGLVFTHGACMHVCVCVLSFVCVCLSMCT